MGSFPSRQVIARIFFSVNRSWSGRVSIPELRKSNFLQVLKVLDEEEDINQVSFPPYEKLSQSKVTLS